MAGRILSQVARRLPEPVRRAGRNWWLHRNPGAPLQLRMARSLDQENLPETPALPSGYELLEHSPGLNEQWLQLLNLSEEFGVLDEAHFKMELLDFLVPQGAAFITHENNLVACAAACALPAFLPSVTLSYVVVRPKHRGFKLGQITTSHVMSAAGRASHSTMILHTDDHRIPAIKTYLKLGFTPVLNASPDAPARWEEVLNMCSA